MSHDRGEESPEAKARWFRSLSMAERIEMLCALTDLALEVNPGLAESKSAQPIPGRIQVLSKADLIASKRAAGRPVDLEDVRLLELPEDGKAGGGAP